jgi:hypothetical protein
MNRSLLTRIFLLIGMASLCAGCRSSYTGLSKTSLNSHSELAGLETRDISRSSLFDFSCIKTDSLHIHITEYYLPAEGDTAARGPVKSDTDIVYGAEITAGSSGVTNENIKELTESDEKTDTSLTEESRTETGITPWYADWKFSLICITVIIVVIYFALRRMHVF